LNPAGSEAGAKIEIPDMQAARATLRKIFAETLRREGGGSAPVMAWPLACGSKVAEKTTALSYHDGVLTVEVPDVAWRYQLQSLTHQYLAAFNQITAQKVERIIFVLPGQRETAPQ
jgi:predicted nucleic acid-binding Zn ribbon protein